MRVTSRGSSDNSAKFRNLDALTSAHGTEFDLRSNINRRKTRQNGSHDAYSSPE